MPSLYDKLKRLLRAGLAGLLATAGDLATLTLLVAVAGWPPRRASIPALVVGGIVNFVGNRDYAFRAQRGSIRRQALGYTAVELVALVLNGALYDTVLRLIPGTAHLFWLVRLCTTNFVFLAWSYPLWARVFRVERTSAGPTPRVHPTASKRALRSR